MGGTRIDFIGIIISMIATLYLTVAGAAYAMDTKEGCFGGPCPSVGSGGSGGQPVPTNIDNTSQPQQKPGTERKLQEQLDKDQRIAEEKKRLQREEFERSKKNALKVIKGGGSSEFGLKGFGNDGNLGFEGSGDFGFKDIKDTNQDTSVVDLRHLDPNKPITVDPNLPKGKQRKIPVQLLDKTLNNENYNRGFAALLANDHATAVQYFNKAKAEFPDDILVKNALSLAEDLAKKQDLAYKEDAKGMLIALTGDLDGAMEHLESAIKMDPKNQSFREDLKYIEGLKKGRVVAMKASKATAEKEMMERAWNIADQSLIALLQKDYDSAILLLKAAQSVKPDEKWFQDALKMVKGFRDGKNKQK